MSLRKRKQQKRNLLGEALTVEEVVTLEELSKHHHYADFRRRALGLLALNSGQAVADIAAFLRVSDQPTNLQLGERLAGTWFGGDSGRT